MNKPCAFSGQSLISHIEGSLRIARTLISEGYVDTVSLRLARALRGKVDPGVLGDIVRDMIEISVIFHDIGKAVKAFQDSYSDSCLCVREGRCGFQYHEIFSAIYLYRLLTRLSEDLLRLYGDAILEPMIMIPVASVINHMHALRSYRDLKSEINSIVTRKTGRAGDIARLIERGIYFEDPVGLAREILRFKDLYYGVKVNEDMLASLLGAKLDAASMQNAVEQIVKEMEYASTQPWSKLYLLVLVPLSIGDNCDSADKRVSDPGEFSSRKTYIRELCCNSLGYYLGSSVGGLQICKDTPRTG
ncbi:MAG TPA: HD domain-containing protein [Sulfolobales archaeon]|nr:HD domain-containing protein [Sulfolobales archaeon]